MADLITQVESEVLTLYESDDIPYIKNIESIISYGTYVKLTNREYIFVEMSKAYDTEVLPQPNKFGYINNLATINFTVEYNEE